MTNHWKKVKRAQKSKWSRRSPANVKLAYLTYEEMIEIASHRESSLENKEAVQGATDEMYKH
jgi:Txe/YoeB family toxin of Txe-Axe toxin-antitoxin module